MLTYTDLLHSHPLSHRMMLQQIQRWSAADVFHYRSSVWFHSQRVVLLVDDLKDLATRCLPGYDPAMARILAAVHDDHEVLTGDIQACHKATMTKAQRLALTKQERKAVERLAKEFSGTIDGYSYGDLLWRAYYKACVMSQVVKLCDKVDSVCEALHEILAGNLSPLPMFAMDMFFFSEFGEKFSLVRPLLMCNREHPLLDWVLRVTKSRSGRCRSHTYRNIFDPTDFPYYNRWKELTIKHLCQGLNSLIRKKECFRRKRSA